MPKCTKTRLADPLGELKRSPRPPSRDQGVLLLEEAKGGKGKDGEGKEGSRVK